jgi:hypothetical protein
VNERPYDWEKDERNAAEDPFKTDERYDAPTRAELEAEEWFNRRRKKDDENP